MNNFKQIKNKNILKYSIVLPFLFTLFFILPTKVSAAPEDQKVYDDYDLFTDEEEMELEDTLNSYGEEGEVDIVVITTDDLGNRSKQLYLEDFYDEMGLGYDTTFGDTVLLLIYMNPSDRSVEIQGYKNAEYYINGERIEYIIDAIYPYLKSGDYYEAVKEYGVQVSTYMNTPLPSTSQNNNGSSGNSGGSNSYNSGNSYNNSNSQNNSYSRVDNLITNPLFQLGISLVIGIVTVCIMATGAGGRITTNNRTYLDAGRSRVTKSYDNYIRTTTTRVKKPENNNNNHTGGSSGGGGVSSGGHSHSGGGRGF
jgi:uncharacterized protein